MLKNTQIDILEPTNSHKEVAIGVKEENNSEKKRYSLALPAPLYEELKKVADEEDKSVVEVLRQYIRLGLYVTKMQKTSDKYLCVTRDGEPLERIVVL